MQVELTEQEIKFLLQAFEVIPVQGVKGASMMVQVAAKLNKAIMPTNGVEKKEGKKNG
jgi:hypothetical protein